MTDFAKAEKEVSAKLFTNGRSQAVRLPREFRFECKEARVRRTEEGVPLEPVEDESGKPWRTLEELYARFSLEEADPIFSEGQEQPEFQERDWRSFESDPVKDLLDSNRCMAPQSMGHGGTCGNQD